MLLGRCSLRPLFPPAAVPNTPSGPFDVEVRIREPSRGTAISASGHPARREPGAFGVHVEVGLRELRSSSVRVSASSAAMAQLRYHLRSDGITYQGAASMSVRRSASAYASW